MRTPSTTHVPLTGSVCECCVCLERFGSEQGFDAHRTGDMGADCRCLSTDELTSRGWRIGARGWTASNAGQHFAKAP